MKTVRNTIPALAAILLLLGFAGRSSAQSDPPGRVALYLSRVGDRNQAKTLAG